MFGVFKMFRMLKQVPDTDWSQQIMAVTQSVLLRDTRIVIATVFCYTPIPATFLSVGIMYEGTERACMAYGHSIHPLTEVLLSSITISSGIGRPVSEISKEIRTLSSCNPIETELGMR